MYANIIPRDARLSQLHHAAPAWERRIQRAIWTLRQFEWVLLNLLHLRMRRPPWLHALAMFQAQLTLRDVGQPC